MAGTKQAELQLSICTGPIFRLNILDLKVFPGCRDWWDFSATVPGGDQAATDALVQSEHRSAGKLSSVLWVGPGGLLHAGLSCLVSLGHQTGPLCPPASDSGNIKLKLSLTKPGLFPSESEGLAQ